MKWLLILTTLLALACTPRNTVSTASAEATAQETVETTQDDMTIGVIQQPTTKSGCEYTIRVKEVSYSLDPTNLGDEFKKDGLKVRFSYRPLRMQSRCPESQPVEVEKMEAI